MRSRMTAAFLAVLMMLSLQAGMGGNPVYGAEKKEVQVVIQGTELPFSKGDLLGIPFVDHNGRTQVPVRKVMEKIGAVVSFEIDPGSGERHVLISKDGISIKLTAGNQLMWVNQDILYQMDTAPEIMEGRTYMPLRAVMEVLGYDVSWDEASKTVAIKKNPEGPLMPTAVSESGVTPVGQFEIPRLQNHQDTRSQVIVNHGYIYYLDQDGAIMQTSFSDLTKSKKIYDGFSGWTVNLFNDEAGIPRLYFHTEGASIGSPHQFVLNTDGSMGELNGNRDYAGEVFVLGGKTFAFTELKFGPDHLEMKDDKGVYTILGGRDNRYQYQSEFNGFNGRRGVYLAGDQLYLIGKPAEGDGDTAVYRIDIKTDEAVGVTDQAYGLQIEGDYLYYNTGKEIRKRNLQDSTETSIYNFFSSATDFAEDFAVLNGKLYMIGRWSIFMEANSREKAEMPGESGITSCTDMALRGDKGEQYLVCQLGKAEPEKNTSRRWMRVYDKEGQVVLERDGEIESNSVSIEGDKICYYNKTTNRVCVEKIK